MHAVNQVLLSDTLADGGTIYWLLSNAGQGIHTGNPIASFYDLKGVNWIYDFKGQQEVVEKRPGVSPLKEKGVGCL